ncbi:MAG TPA: hypothetical protein VI072_21930 [Polyangiaceae bacterium]
MPLDISDNWAATCQRARTLAVLGALTLVASHAGARDRLQGVGQASLGYTDNVRSSPDEAIYAPDEPSEVLVPEKTGDVFAMLSPGLVYGIENPGSAHRFTYTYTASLFFDNWGANSYSNRLEWRGGLEPHPRLQLIFVASATQSHQHTQGTLLSASQTALNATVPGTGAFILAGGSQSLVYELSPEWAFLQGTGAGAQFPIFDTEGSRTYQISQRLGLERVWLSDAVGLEGRGNYVAYRGTALRETALGTFAGGDQSQFVAELVGTWRHDFGYYFASRVEAGAARVWMLERGRQFSQPIGLAALSYIHENGEAELSYRHALTTSVFLGQTFLSDEVRLRASIPLDEDDKIFLSASSGYQRSRILDEYGDLATRVDLWLGDVALSYEVLPVLTVAARYQHVEQVSGAELPPLPLSYVRNTGLLTATVEYPPEREMPRTYRESRRVDRSDVFESSYEDPTEAQPGPAAP